MAKFSHRLKDEFIQLAGRLGLSGPGWIRGAGLHILLLVLFGIALPYRKGVDFFDPVILAAYACLGAVFAAPAAVPSLPAADLARARSRILVSVAYGELMTLAMLALGIGTVYWTHRRSFVLTPDLDSLLTASAFGLALSLALATLAVWMGLRFSASVAKVALRLVFFGLLLGFLWNARRLLEILLPGAGFALAVAALFWLALPSALRQVEGDLP
jgi:hypothetical protein